MIIAQAVTIARDVGEPRLVELPRAPAGHVAAASSTHPPVGLRRPVSASTSSSWPLPATPAMPRISPARTSRSTPRTTSRPRSSLTCRSVDRQRRAGRVRLATIDGELDVPADHELRKVLLVRLRGDPLADDPAPPDDRDPIGDLEDLVELVADEDDRVALRREPTQDGEDLFRLLRGEDGGRFVEDEDPGIAVERLEDLDPLLPADGQVPILASGSISKPNCSPNA